MITPSEIETIVAARFALTLDEMREVRRDRKVSRPRQIAMALSREYTDWSLPRLGRHFGRDHTTILHGMRRVATLAAAYPRFAEAVQSCRDIISRVEAHEADREAA